MNIELGFDPEDINHDISVGCHQFTLPIKEADYKIHGCKFIRYVLPVDDRVSIEQTRQKAIAGLSKRIKKDRSQYNG